MDLNLTCEVGTDHDDTNGNLYFTIRVLFIDKVIYFNKSMNRKTGCHTWGVYNNRLVWAN